MPTNLLAVITDQDSLSERFDQFDLKLTRRCLTAEAHATVDAVIKALTELPDRDRFAMTVEIDDDAVTISAPSEASSVQEHIARYHSDGELVKVRVEIFKEVVQQRLSVYSPVALGAYLDATPLPDALAALSSRFEDGLIFECYSGTPGIGSATLRFEKAGDSILDSVALAWRHRTLALLQDNAYLTGYSGTLVPYDFVMIQPIGVATLDAFLARAGAVLAAMFLSNTADLGEDRLVYRLAGYKLLSGSVDSFAKLVDDGATFQRIAEWAYGAEGNSDKIGLARNVISLCVQRLEEVPTHHEIWDAIQSNYQIYLKENIATYLEVRNKLAELLAESTHKTHSLVEGLLDSIRNGVLVVLTFLLTVVVINGLKDTGIEVIFSAGYLSIVLGLLVLSTFAIWASCCDARSRFDQSARATSELLRRMYTHVMIAAEIEKQVTPTVDENRTYMNRQTKRYMIFWLVFAGLAALAFAAGHWCFGRVDRPSANAATGITHTPSPSLGSSQSRIAESNAASAASPPSSIVTHGLQSLDLPQAVRTQTTPSQFERSNAALQKNRKLSISHQVPKSSTSFDF